jgi:hypothetical protein
MVRTSTATKEWPFVVGVILLVPGQLVKTIGDTFHVPLLTGIGQVAMGTGFLIGGLSALVLIRQATVSRRPGYIIIGIGLVVMGVSTAAVGLTHAGVTHEPVGLYAEGFGGVGWCLIAVGAVAITRHFVSSGAFALSGIALVLFAVAGLLYVGRLIDIRAAAVLVYLGFLVIGAGVVLLAVSDSHKWRVLRWWALARWTRITERYGLPPTNDVVTTWSREHRQLLVTYASSQGPPPMSPTWILPTTTAVLALIGLDKISAWYRTVSLVGLYDTVLTVGAIYLLLMFAVALVAESRRTFWHWCLQRALEIEELKQYEGPRTGASFRRTARPDQCALNTERPISYLQSTTKINSTRLSNASTRTMDYRPPGSN